MVDGVTTGTGERLGGDLTNTPRVGPNDQRGKNVPEPGNDDGIGIGRDRIHVNMEDGLGDSTRNGNNKRRHAHGTCNGLAPLNDGHRFIDAEVGVVYKKLVNLLRLDNVLGNGGKSELRVLRIVGVKGGAIKGANESRNGERVWPNMEAEIRADDGALRDKRSDVFVAKVSQLNEEKDGARTNARVTDVWGNDNNTAFDMWQDGVANFIDQIDLLVIISTTREAVRGNENGARTAEPGVDLSWILS
ncbi:hypothetical protein BDZ89DRAFT_1260662 [Hymenopellis radicata]|nr:hypothetical protein BDZ89DRAFT_1260662 [Hymenopellis radicata]